MSDNSMPGEPARPLPPVRVRTRTPSPTTPTAPQPRLAHPEPEPEHEPYKVGYGRPPLHTQFRKGQSGNPKGRPRGAKSLNTLARERLIETIKIRTSRGEKKVSRMEALLMKTIEKAANGDARAFENLAKLYAAAVPDAPIVDQPESDDQLSAVDELTLNLMRQRYEAKLAEEMAAKNAARQHQAEDGQS